MVGSSSLLSHASVPMIAPFNLPFRPHPLLRSGHSQTLMGWLLSSTDQPYSAKHHEVILDDYDRLLMHDDCPEAWQPGDRNAMLIHGLNGCHQSAYMVRIADKLNRLGIRTFRLDMRGAGAGMSLARNLYHAGRSEDLARALDAIAEICPGSPTAMMGFSLGGAVTLKMLGECGSNPPGNLDRAVAVCPPIDMKHCADSISRPRMQMYERYIVNGLTQQITQQRRTVSDSFLVEPCSTLRSIWQFDDEVTAPSCGFESAADYYRRCSSAPLLPEIRVPTLILTSQDDPVIPGAQFDNLRLPRAVTLEITRHGGHLGFICAAKDVADRRWMDQRIIAAITSDATVANRRKSYMG